MAGKITTVIQTLDGKKKIEFTDEEFNYFQHLLVIKTRSGNSKNPQEIRKIMLSKNEKLLMQ